MLSVEKDVNLCHSQEIYLTNMENSTATKTGLDALKTASKKIVPKVAKATGESKGDQIANKIVKLKSVIGKYSRNVEKIVISPEKKEEILNELKQLL